MENASFSRSHARQAAREGIRSLCRKSRQLAYQARAVEVITDPEKRKVAAARFQRDCAALKREVAVLREFGEDVGVLTPRH